MENNLGLRLGGVTAVSLSQRHRNVTLFLLNNALGTLESTVNKVFSAVVEQWDHICAMCQSFKTLHSSALVLLSKFLALSSKLLSFTHRRGAHSERPSDPSCQQTIITAEIELWAIGGWRQVIPKPVVKKTYPKNWQIAAYCFILCHFKIHF